MKIYETSVRRPISTILVFIGVVVLGVFSYRNLAVDMYPDMDMPAITVVTTYSGANASSIETNVTRVLEDNLNTVNNLKKITSKSQDNYSLITLEFEWGSDMTEAANDVRDVLGRMGDYLPDDADEPILIKFSSSMMPAMVLGVTAEETYPGLAKLLDELLVNRLSRINGVGSVTIMGAPEREIQINVDPRKIEAYGMTVEQIGGIVAGENVNIPAGTIDIGNNTFNVKTDGEFTTSDDLYGIVLANVNGKDVYLRDVAQIKDTLETATLDERINSKLGVRALIQKQSGANTVQIVNEVMAVLPSIQAALPNDVTLNIAMDGSESILNSIGTLQETVLLAFLFVMLVVLFFLGRWRAAFIVLLTIPISLIVSFIYLYVVGSTINIISLSSLSIAIGLVVDDAIVVLENITKHMERGSSPKEAAVYGTNEVWLAVMAATMTIVAVFLPLTLVSGMAGILLRELGWIMTIVILTSLVAAITLTPMLCAKLLRNDEHTYKGLGKIFKPIDKFLNNLDHWYGSLLNWVLHHRALVLSVVGVIFIAGMYVGTKVESEFMPASDNATISAVIELEQNIGVQYTSQIARKIDNIIYEKYPEVYILSTSSGQNSSSNAFAAMMTTGSNIINLTMRLEPISKRDRTIFEISELFRKDLEQIPEIKDFTVSPGGNYSTIGGVSNVEVKIYGYDFNTTTNIANDIKEKLQHTQGARDVNVSREDMRPEYNVKLDRNLLAYNGLNSSTVATAVRNRNNGYEAAKYREDGDEYDIIVRYGEPFRTSIADIENILVYNSSGKGIRIADLGEVVEEFAPPTIERENRQRVVTVTATLADGVPLGQLVNETNEILADYAVPDGVSIDVGGSVEDMQDTFTDLFTILVLIVLLVYIVMAVQFESLLMPFIIMFTILLAVPGVFFALKLTNTALGMMAMVGVIMLVGIVVKNGIVMVDYMNLMHERGHTIKDSVILSGKSRLRPVLMTSIATILGMLPLAISQGEGSEMWQPLGVAVVGGLLISTLLTLLVVPVIYSLLVTTSEKRKIRKMNRQKRRDARKTFKADMISE